MITILNQRCNSLPYIVFNKDIHFEERIDCYCTELRVTENKIKAFFTVCISLIVIL